MIARRMVGASEIFAPGLLAGQVALVTGGGTGLGRGTALELARCGARVVVAGRREEPLRAAVEEIGDLGGDAVAHWVAGDVREPDEAERIVRAALDWGGRLDVLVNNAGGQYFTPAEAIAAKGWRAVWRLNVDGTLNMCQAAYALAFARGGGGGGSSGDAGRTVEPGSAGISSGDAGRTVEPGPAGISGSGAKTVEHSPSRTPRSDAGRTVEHSPGATIVNVTLSPHHGMPGMAHSGAARAAVETLTRELAQRWTGDRVTVVAAAAGHFDTEALDKYPEAIRAGTARSVPVQRLGTVREHAWLVALLASPLGRAFNGGVVTLDGARDNWFGPWPPPGMAGEGGEVPAEERRARR